MKVNRDVTALRGRTEVRQVGASLAVRGGGQISKTIEIYNPDLDLEWVDAYMPMNSNDDHDVIDTLVHV